MEDPELKGKNSPLNDLIQLIESLRGPDGCPWDKKQVPASIVIYLIEEIYELDDAIRSGNPDEICEDCGHRYDEHGVINYEGEICPGNWVIRLPNNTYHILSEQDFNCNYEEA